MYFTEANEVVAPVAHAHDLPVAIDEQPAVEASSVDGGAVAVAERVVVAAPVTSQEVIAPEASSSIQTSIGLAVAVVGVFALGIAPWLVTPLAAEAARTLFAGR
jgi:hypothetical protein